MLKKTLIALIILFPALPVTAEYLFLKDGAIIKGSITTETRDAITFRSDEDKQTKRAIPGQR